MNEEIKEILYNLKEHNALADEEDTYLYNYITNLQQENERLKASIDWWKDRFFGQQEYDDSHRIVAVEYKKRIDKAVEYINENKHLSMFADCRELEEDWIYDLECSANDLLSILQNGSEENVSDRD